MENRGLGVRGVLGGCPGVILDPGRNQEPKKGAKHSKNLQGVTRNLPKTYLKCSQRLGTHFGQTFGILWVTFGTLGSNMDPKWKTAPKVTSRTPPSDNFWSTFGTGFCTLVLQGVFVVDCRRSFLKARFLLSCLQFLVILMTPGPSISLPLCSGLLGY